MTTNATREIVKSPNGYELSRAWFDFCFENPEKISPKHSAIYFFAIEHCNRLGWKRKFGFPSQMTMEAIGIKKHQTYINAFKDLVDWNFFTLIQKSTNQYSANIICLTSAFPKKDKALDKAIVKHRARQGQSTGQGNGHINKQVNQLTNKPINQEEADFDIIKASEEIIKLYPAERIGLPREAQRSVFNAIMREIEKGTAKDWAIKVIKESTIAYANNGEGNEFKYGAKKWYDNEGYHNVVAKPKQSEMREF